MRTRYEILSQPAQEVTEVVADTNEQQPVEGQQDGRKREREDSRDRSRSSSFHNPGTLVSLNPVLAYLRAAHLVNFSHRASASRSPKAQPHSV